MMRGDVFEGSPSGEGGGRIKPGLIAVGLVAAAAALGVAFCTGRGTASPGATLPTPTPLPTVRAVKDEAIVNGVQLWDDDRVAWLSYYRANQDLLGQPVGWTRVDGGSGDADCVAFDYYVICHIEDGHVRGLWEYVPLTLGYDALPDGANIELDAPFALAAGAYLDDVKASGRDAIYWIGRAISSELCSATECIQYFERAVLRWPSIDDVVPARMSRAMLGRAFVPD